MYTSTALSNNSITTNSLVWPTTNALDSINITGALDVTASSGRLDLKGEGADIVINNVSLNDTLKGIQERLNLLTPNTALESEWNELRELGARYRQLEADLLAKQKMWATLQK